jgi:hypothetical protein
MATLRASHRGMKVRIDPETDSGHEPPADAPQPHWSEALQDDIYYASDIDPYIDRLRATQPPCEQRFQTDGLVQIIEEHGQPSGIRDRRGFLCFFPRVHKYDGQEERYQRELAERALLAQSLLASLTRPAPPPVLEQPIATAPKDGREVLVRVKWHAGIPGKWLVGHYMGGGHCIEDHPPIDAGWYFWNGLMFDKAAEPVSWAPLPPDDPTSTKSPVRIRSGHLLEDCPGCDECTGPADPTPGEGQ